MKRYKWDEDKLKILISEYKKADIKVLCDRLGCKPATLYNKAFQLGLKRGQLTNQKNLKHDIDWLKKNYSLYSNKTLAIYFGTSVRYIKKLGIKYSLRKSEEYYRKRAEFCLKRRKAKWADWRARNRERQREYNKNYRIKNKDDVYMDMDRRRETV